MAKNKLNAEQQSVLLKWLAADYDTALILKWFAEREWPVISQALVSYYRTRYSNDVETIRQARRRSALSRGLALKEERVARLCHHADELEAIKWEPDDKGRLWNEKAWRETLADIAAEKGERKVGVEHSGPDGGPIRFAQMSDAELDAWLLAQAEKIGLTEGERQLFGSLFAKLGAGRVQVGPGGEGAAGV